MKTALKFILILAVAAFLVVSMMRIPGKNSENLCTGTELEIVDSLQTNLIDKAEIEGILKRNQMIFDNMKIVDINLGQVESKLSTLPYVDTVYANFNVSGKLILTVIPRTPVLHIMANNGEDYYLDRSGVSIPVGKLKSNLTIVTGNINKTFAKAKLASVGHCIQNDEFWRLQIQQIDVVNQNDVRLYTRIADHTIHLGSLDSIEQKLHTLRIFYQEGLPQTGWNRYESLNLEYSGMVIGTKKEKKQH